MAAISEKQAAYRNDLIQKKLGTYQTAWPQTTFRGATEAVRTLAIVLALPGPVDSFEMSDQIGWLTSGNVGSGQVEAIYGWTWAGDICRAITNDVADAVDRSLGDLAMDEYGIWRDLTIDELRNAVEAQTR